jgi:hypothetical protein
MINKKSVTFVWAVLNLVLLGCAYDLTGTWRGDDGGTYYIRQIGNDIFWFGELTPQNPGWANVAYGTISGNIINLKWADVPKSGARGSGTLSLSVITLTPR